MHERTPSVLHPSPARMSVDEFLVWASAVSGQYELVDGVPIAMAAERAGHARAKLALVNALREAIARAGLPCEAFTDGMTVRIDEHNGFEPDAVVHCGEPIDDDESEVPSPVIVVEVVSPWSIGRDSNTKLDDYFRVASVRHYLIVDTRSRRVVHYRRGDDGEPAVSLASGDTLTLDPPGIEPSLQSMSSDGR